MPKIHITEDGIETGVGLGVLVLFFFAVLLKLGFIGFIIWAIYRLVVYLTSGNAGG